MTTILSRAAWMAAVLTAGMGSAGAADLYRPAPVPQAEAYPATIVDYGFNWTGAYVGANIGNRWVRDAVTPRAGGRYSLDSSSIAGGLQAGYLFQTGRFVYGAEVDATYGDNAKTRGVPGGRVSAALDWSASARGRAGVALDRVLVYGTAGVGIAGFESTGRGGGASAKKSDTAVGWTAGGGLEYAVTKNVSVRGEYLYADYGRNNVSYGGTGIASNRQDLTSHLTRLGVNFKF